MAKFRGRSKRQSNKRKSFDPRRGPSNKGHSHSQKDHPRGGGKIHTGRIQKNPNGFAFIIPSTPGQKDAYVSKGEAAQVLNGDRVEYRVHQRGRFTDAEIVQVLERAQTHVTGKVLARGKNRTLETPDGEVFVFQDAPPFLNEWAIGKIEHYPTLRTPAVVSLAERIGKDLLPKHDYLLAISRFGLSVSFSKNALIDAKNSASLAEKEFKHLGEHRKDLRKLPFVTIDGPDAKDFDDAVYVERIPEKGAYRLYVAIADVSFFVRPGTALDKEAQDRSTSVYLPGWCIPMLPEELSNDLCSLNPQTDKLVLVAEMEVNASGIQKSKFYEGVICTAGRLTYKKVEDFAEGKVDEIPEVARPSLEAGYELFRIFLQLRSSRGVLDFELPEAKYELDDKGFPIEIKPAPKYSSHKFIEEFMIAANTAVAEVLRKAEMPSLYRVHENPSNESIEDLNALMRSLGFSMTIREMSPKALSKILAETTGKKGASTLHKAILRAQKQARYEHEPKGHFGLALRDYTHFTSPIRRYPDLLVHRALKRFILREKHSDKTKETERLVSLGELTSERERKAMEAERFVSRRKQCWFMKKRLGETFPAVISGIIPKGVFVEILEFAIEGFVPVESLAGYYSYDESKGCMRRKPGHSTLNIGDPLEIQVMDVNLDENQITLRQLPEEK